MGLFPDFYSFAEHHHVVNSFIIGSLPSIQRQSSYLSEGKWSTKIYGGQRDFNLHTKSESYGIHTTRPELAICSLVDITHIRESGIKAFEMRPSSSHKCMTSMVLAYASIPRREGA